MSGIYGSTLNPFRHGNEGKRFSELLLEYQEIKESIRIHKEQKDYDIVYSLALKIIPYAEFIRLKFSNHKVYNEAKMYKICNLVEDSDVFNDFINDLIIIAAFCNKPILVEYALDIYKCYNKNTKQLGFDIYFINRGFQALPTIYQHLFAGEKIHRKKINKLLGKNFEKVDWDWIFRLLESQEKIKKIPDEDGSSYYISIP